MSRISKFIAWLSSCVGVTVTASLAILGLFLFTEHRAHVLGALLYILLLLFLILHLFMNSKHGDHSSGKRDGKADNTSSREDKT